jgi:hypothetical protein
MGDAKKELVAARAEIASLKANRERQGQELNFPNRTNNGYRRSDNQSSSNHSSSARWVPYKQNQFGDTFYGPENGWDGNRPRALSSSSGNHRVHVRGRNRAFSDGAYNNESYNDGSYNDRQRSESRGWSRARNRRGRGGDPHGYNSARDRDGGSSYGGSHDGGGSNGHGGHDDRSRSRNSRGGQGTDNSQKRAKLPQITLHNPDEWRYAIKKGVTLKHRGPLVRLCYYKDAIARSTTKSALRYLEASDGGERLEDESVSVKARPFNRWVQSELG